MTCLGDVSGFRGVASESRVLWKNGIEVKAPYEADSECFLEYHVFRYGGTRESRRG